MIAEKLLDLPSYKHNLFFDEKFAVTMLLAFIVSNVTFAQIPGPKYSNYKYLDSTYFNRPHKHGNKLQPKVLFGLVNSTLKVIFLTLEIMD